MSQPWPQNPPQLPHPPRTITVAVKPCCELIAGDVCTCADDFAETLMAFTGPAVQFGGQTWHVTRDFTEGTPR